MLLASLNANEIVEYLQFDNHPAKKREPKSFCSSRFRFTPPLDNHKYDEYPILYMNLFQTSFRLLVLSLYLRNLYLLYRLFCSETVVGKLQLHVFFSKTERNQRRTEV